MAKAKEPVTVDEPWDNEKQKALLSEELEKLKAAKVKYSYDLPEILNLPRPYDPVEGVWYKKPKLGHRRDLLMKMEKAGNPDSFDGNSEERWLFAMVAVMPYTFVMDPATGTPRKATEEDMLYNTFEDQDQLADFMMFLCDVKVDAGTDEGAAPNG